MDRTRAENQPLLLPPWKTVSYPDKPFPNKSIIHIPPSNSSFPLFLMYDNKDMQKLRLNRCRVERLLSFRENNAYNVYCKMLRLAIPAEVRPHTIPNMSFPLDMLLVTASTGYKWCYMVCNGMFLPFVYKGIFA